MVQTKRFLCNGAILACTTVFLRGIGVGFNVYITRKIGAEGVGLFGLIMSVYFLATTVASSGASLAATRLVTEELSLSCGRGIHKSMTACLLYTLFFGFLSAFLLFFFAGPIGNFWLGDARTVPSLRLLAISMPFISVSSVASGYFTAVRRVAKSALAQIFEVFVKICITVLALHILANRGIEAACMAVVGGGSFAEIASFCLMFLLYKMDVKRYNNKREKEKCYWGRLLEISLPVAVSAYLRSGLLTLEHILVPRGLKKFGASSSASLAQYGVVHGMVMPVLLFPSAVISAFAGLLVPELAELHKQGKHIGINRVAGRAFRLTLVFGIGAAGIFFAFAEELGLAVYHSADAGLFIRFLAPLVAVMYTDSVTDAMLKGLNQQASSMRYNLIDSAVSVALIYSVLPRAGINGYIAVLFVTELLNAFLSINRLMTVTDFCIMPFRHIALPFLVILLSSYGVRHLAMLWFGAMPMGGVPLFLLIALTSLLYLAIVAVFSRQKG